MTEIKTFLETIMQGKSLRRGGARDAMNFLISGEATDAQIGAFLGAYRARGSTAEELAGFVDAMRAAAVKISVERAPLVDTCGTGGDGKGSFNISTAAAFVTAGAGVAVAKHGNRAVSSQSGSADVLEALGVPLDLPPDAAKASIEKHGFAFLFAQQYHPAMKHVAKARKELGVRTVFNILGPLVNPAGVRRQVVGVYDAAFAATYANVLAMTGCEEALVVHGADGLDELTLAGKTYVCRLREGRVSSVEVTPEDAGLRRAPSEAVRGGSAQENAKTLTRIFAGEETGPLRDAVALNAAAALVVAGVAQDFREGAALAQESITSGRAMAVLTAVRKEKP